MQAAAKTFSLQVVACVLLASGALSFSPSTYGHQYSHAGHRNTGFGYPTVNHGNNMLNNMANNMISNTMNNQYGQTTNNQYAQTTTNQFRQRNINGLSNNRGLSPLALLPFIMGGEFGNEMMETLALMNPRRNNNALSMLAMTNRDVGMLPLLAAMNRKQSNNNNNNMMANNPFLLSMMMRHL